MNRNLRRAWLSAKVRAMLATIVLVLGLGVTTAVMATPASADTGGYPDSDASDCSATYGQYSWCKGGTWLSSRSYGYRNCTDWVAWRLAGLSVSASTYKYLGNANQWPGRVSGVTVNTTPTKGAAAVKTTGTFGHIAFVESVSGGNITVSEYNRAGTGLYGTRTGTPANLGFTQFIHFEALETWPDGSSGAAEVRPTASGDVPWNFTVLEGDSGAQSGQSGDIGRGTAVATYNGSQQAFYYDATGGNLRHAWRVSGGSWSFETLDGAGGSSGRMDGNVGLNPTVAVYGDSIQVFYYDAGNGNLRHAFASSTSGWQFETLDGDSGAVSHQSGNVGASSKAVSYASNGNLYVFYPNTDTGSLRTAVADATGWHFLNVDGDSGSLAGQAGNYGQAVGASLTATVVGSDMQLFYYEAYGDNLRHAWYNTTSGWSFETLDGDSGSISGYDSSVGQNPSVTVMGSSIQLFYYDAGTGSLRHAWSGSSGWHFENLDGGGSIIGPNRFQVGLYSSAVSLDGSSIQVVYFDNRWTNLRHAWSDSSGWHFENLDGLGGGPAGRINTDVGSFPVLTSFGGTLNAFYYDIVNGNLRMATAQ